MSKTSLILIIGVIVLATTGLIFFTLRETPASQDLTMIRPVPVNAALILGSQNFPDLLDNLLSESNLRKELSAVPWFTRLYGNLNIADSIRKSNPEWQTLFQGASGYISFHPSGKNDFGVLFSISLKTSSEAQLLDKAIRPLFEKNAPVTSTDFNGQKIFRVRPLADQREKELVWTVRDHFLLASFSSLLLEESINQLGTDASLLDDKAFVRIASTAGKNVQANVFINHQRLKTILDSWTSPNERPLTQGSHAYGEWTALDVSVRSNELLFSGFTFSNDSSERFISSFSGQAPGHLELEQILPSSTSQFAGFILSDRGKFRSRLAIYQEFYGSQALKKQQLTQWAQSFGAHPADQLYSILDQEFGYCQIPGTDTLINKFFILKTASASHAITQLQPFIIPVQEKATKKGKKKEPALFTHDPATEADIYQFALPELPAIVLGDFFAGISCNYFVLVGNYLVFGSEPSGVASFFYENSLKKTLVNDPDFQVFKEKFGGKSNFFLYTSIPENIPRLSKFFAGEFGPGLSGYKQNLSRFQAFAFQFRNSGKKHLYATDAILLYNPVKLEKPKTRWESHLDTLAAIKPKFLINHTNQEKEIFVQDLNNTIYLIDKTGRIIWQKRLKERIQSEVFQVDVMKNGKLQLLFGTRTEIHLLDRNGNYLDRFPVKLNSPATNGISLFDYEKNRDYRIAVACQDKRIYLFNKEGNGIRDWAFKTTENHVTTEIQHFRVGTRDYLVFSDKYKTYFLDRKGNTRLTLQKSFARSKQNGFILHNPGKPEDARLICTDTTGQIQFIDFHGLVETKKSGSYSSNHWFDLQDIDGDGTKDFLFADGQKLEAFSQALNPIFQLTTNEPIGFRPVYYLFPGNKGKVGVVTPSSTKLYLFNSDGSLYEGFPLTGLTPFSIGILEDPAYFNLIVGGKGGFIYNYVIKP